MICNDCGRDRGKGIQLCEGIIICKDCAKKRGFELID